MIKILFITTGLTTGGAEVMLYRLLSGIDRNKFAPIVLSLMDRSYFGDRIAQLDIPVYTLDMNQGKPSVQKFFKVISLIRREQPQIIQGWMYHGNIAAQLASLLSFQKIPVSWSIHHSIHSLQSEKPLTQAIIRFGAWTSQAVDKVAYVSQVSQQQHLRLGYPTDNSCTIPNGFDTNALQPSSTIKQQFHQQLNIPLDSILIGSIARYHPMKDQANFLKAARILLNEYPDTRFILVGTGVDSQNSALNDLITELNLAHRVHLLGERRDIPQITPALDILTSSSAFGEAFPLVIGEAMSCGVPCVATDIGDSAAIIGDTGVIVPPKNPQALAQGWKKIIELDTEAKKALKIKARQRIVNRYSLETIIAQYENLYQKMIPVAS